MKNRVWLHPHSCRNSGSWSWLSPRQLRNDCIITAGWNISWLLNTLWLVSLCMHHLLLRGYVDVSCSCTVAQVFVMSLTRMRLPWRGVTETHYWRVGHRCYGPHVCGGVPLTSMSEELVPSHYGSGWKVLLGCGENCKREKRRTRGELSPTFTK